MQYPEMSGLAPDLRKIVADKRNTNVYKMLMHTPNIAPGFTAMADAVMWSKTWPATWRELAIVRVGHHYKAPYEVHHHVRIGRLMGLNDDQLAACAIGAGQAALSHEERTILRLTDALVERHGLNDAECADALAFLNANQLADLVLTVGFYQMVCNFLNTFQVEVEQDDPFAGAQTSDAGADA